MCRQHGQQHVAPHPTRLFRPFNKTRSDLNSPLTHPALIHTTTTFPFVCSPGRFDSVVYVPPPDQPGRLAALKVHTRGMPLAADVDLASLAQRTPRYTGAELAAVCREAALAAVREDEEGAEVVAGRHFEAALAGVRATLGEAELARYAAWPAG